MDPILSLHPLARAWLLDGPLSANIDSYIAMLERGSYSEGASEKYVRALAHYAHWMTRCRLSTGQLDEAFVEQFLDSHLPRCDCHATALRTHGDLRAGLGHLLELLREQGVIAELPTPTGPIVDELCRYDAHRRLLRSADADVIALAAETPDPRRSPPTSLFGESEVALHRVVGMLFSEIVNPPKSKHEAVRIDGSGLLPKVLTAYRIKEESAIPLALPGQIALGGRLIALSDFDSHLDTYVALHLSDGSSIFKRVGEKLPNPLSHLRRFESIGGLGVADVLVS